MGPSLIFFWLPVLAGVLVGRACGGRFANLGALDVKHLWLLPLVVGIQALVVLPEPVLPELGVDPMRYVLPLTTGALCVWAVLNRALPGMWLVLLGATCNLAAICANGGLMPTNADALARAGKHESIALSQAHPGIRLPNSKDVLLTPEETQLWWLSDVIVSPPLPQRKVMSAGDVILAAGLAWLAGRATYAPLASVAPLAPLGRRPRAYIRRLRIQENVDDAPDTTAPDRRTARRAEHVVA